MSTPAPSDNVQHFPCGCTLVTLAYSGTLAVPCLRHAESVRRVMEPPPDARHAECEPCRAVSPEARARYHDQGHPTPLGAWQRRNG